MKQVIRKGLKDIIVDEVPDPVLRRTTSSCGRCIR